MRHVARKMVYALSLAIILIVLFGIRSDALAGGEYKWVDANQNCVSTCDNAIYDCPCYCAIC